MNKNYEIYFYRFIRIIILNKEFTGLLKKYINSINFKRIMKKFDKILLFLIFRRNEYF